jgi:hypothetical protein
MPRLNVFSLIEQQGEATAADIAGCFGWTIPGATFTLSQAPGREWIQFFKERSSASVLNIAAATFRRNRLSVEVAGHGDLEMLIRSVEAMIEGVNFDVEFRR